MITMRHILGCSLLFSTFGAWANAFNGNITGIVDDRPIDVAVVCNQEAIGNKNWLTAHSDPSMHGGLKDRNGDGIAISVSSNGEQAVFEVLAGGQQYRFSGTKDVAFSSTGLAIKSRLTHFEGKGKERKEIGQYAVDLTLKCPEA